MNYSQINAFVEPAAATTTTAGTAAATTLAPGTSGNDMVINTPTGASYKVSVGAGANATDAAKILQKVGNAIPACGQAAVAAVNPAVVADPNVAAAAATMNANT